MGKSTHGVSSFGYAMYKETPTGNQVFDAPVFINGTIGASISTESKVQKRYADNVVYCMVNGAKTISGEVTIADIPKEYAEIALGKKTTSFGGLVDSGTAKGHCIFWVEEVMDCSNGTTTQKITYVYNAMMGQVEEEAETDGEEVTFKDFVLPFDASASAKVLDDDGLPVAMMTIERTTQNATTFDKYKTEVILPTTTVAGP